MNIETLLKEAKDDYSTALNVTTLITLGELKVNVPQLLESFLIACYWIEIFDTLGEDDYKLLSELFQSNRRQYLEIFQQCEGDIAFYLREVSNGLSSFRLKEAQDFVAQIQNFPNVPDSLKSIQID